jgi:hypothetical protein
VGTDGVTGVNTPVKAAIAGLDGSPMTSIRFANRHSVASDRGADSLRRKYSLTTENFTAAR